MSESDTARITILEKNQDKLFKHIEELLDRTARIETMLQQYSKPGCSTECLRQNERISMIETTLKEVEKSVIKITATISTASIIISFALQHFVK
jgi:prefoldin subunit 5